jgi:CO dehydrogenase/acetyl-CoA synthase epsilon subunit
MPIVDGRIVLHSRITAEVSALGNHTHQITSLVGVANFAGFDEAGLPFTIVLYGLHKIISDTDRIIGILKEHTAVSRTIQAGIISRFD